MTREAARPLPRTIAAVEQGREEGHHLGAQLYVSLAGEAVADQAIGESEPGRPLERGDLMLWLSSSKPVTAIALGQLWEEGRLDLDDRIADYVPEFGRHGKQVVTIRQALTHTGGFRMFDVGWPRFAWDETIQRIADARLEPRWVPGRTAGYHGSASWFVLGEIVQRLVGKPFSEAIRQRIFEPLGLEDSWIGMPAERCRSYGPRIVPFLETSDAEPKPLPGQPELRFVHPSPAGGGVGPMRELGRFYEALLGSAPALVSRQTVEAMTARHRVGLYDKTFRCKMDWGLGFIPDSKHYGAEVPYAYGAHCSARTYGHSGMRSSVAFADPEHRLVVALAFNGLPSDEAHAERVRRVLEAIYEDLGLANPSREPTRPAGA